MYAVIADAHLGHIPLEDEEFFFSKLKELRKEGLSIIWLGDTFDLVWMRSAYAVYRKILQDGDILLIGNHDFTLIDNKIGKRELFLGNTTFLTHGDYLDFGFFTARMEKFWKNLYSRKVTAIEIAAKLLYPHWKFEDADALFRLMVNLDEYILNLFSHDPNFKYNKLVAMWKLLQLFGKAKRYLKAVEYETLWDVSDDLPMPDKDGHVFGYFTFDPEELYKRFQTIYTPYAHAKTIFVGHMHKPEDNILENGTRFVVVGSWQRHLEKGIYPTVPILDPNGSIIEIREYR